LGQAGEGAKRSLDYEFKTKFNIGFTFAILMNKPSKGRYRIGWFSTGGDEAVRDLLRAVWRGIKEGEIKAGITLMFSNREPGETAESDAFFELVHGVKGILAK
jgi:hypothetical protein